MVQLSSSLKQGKNKRKTDFYLYKSRQITRNLKKIKIFNGKNLKNMTNFTLASKIKLQ